MREADRRCIQELGIPGAVLMHNAGAAVFSEIDSGPVGIVCGKGNNGGDGYVVARLALLAGYSPLVVLIADPAAVTGDAKVYLDAYTRLGGAVQAVHSEDETERAITGLSNRNVIVDALLGTGVHGEVRGSARAAIEAWPTVRTIAVDVPSGLNADAGEPCGCAVHANVTVTFQFAKRGLLEPVAQPYVGRLVVADIGIPDICADDKAWANLRNEW